MVKIEVKPELKTKYLEAIFGSMIVMNVPNCEKNEALEELKRIAEMEIREINVEKDSILQSYKVYFKKWGKTYPVEFQIKTIKRGGKLPQISVLVDSMFVAELKNRILTSGHDLDAIQGDLIFDVSKGGERYIMLNGKEQELKENDIILKDEEGILASVLYGLARRTSITFDTRNVLYLAWYPYGMDDRLIISHLNDVLSNLRAVFKFATSEIKIHH